MDKEKTLIEQLVRAEVERIRGPIDLQSRLRNTLFKQQLDLVFDAQHPKRVACCSRRAGKTQGLIRGMILRALERPRSVIAYFGMTLKSARKIVWDVPDGIPDIITQLGIDAVCEVNESEHRVSFKNGSVLWVTGCETKPDARMWKGLRYDLAIVDEAQDWTEEILAYLVHEVLSPALMDRKGEMVLTGTPSALLDGLFYQAANGNRKGWSVHSWTCFENPHLDAKAFVKAEMEDRGLLESDPIVQREFYGRWVRDVNTQLYQYQPGRNDYTELPQANAWQHVLGIDYGSRDLTTFVLNSFRQYDRCVYTSEAYGESMAGQASVTRSKEIIQSFQQKCGPGLQIVADAGALGLFISDELRVRYGIPVLAAKKQEKAAAIRLLNDQMRLGLKRYGPSTSKLKDQLLKVQLDPRTQIEKASSPCDYADADLYGWRHCYAYLAQPEPDHSVDGQRREMIARVMKRQQEGSWDQSEAAERREMVFEQ